MGQTMILDCGCRGAGGVTGAATFQDEVYGAGRRVHAKTMDEDMYRCVICRTERKKPGKQLSKKELKALKEAEKAAKAEKSQDKLGKRR